MLGQRTEHDGLAAVQARLCAVAAVVLMDLQLAEAHGCPAELAQDGALLALPGLMKRQLLLPHGLLAHGAPDLLVPVLAVLIHLRLGDRLLALGARDQEQQAVRLVEGQVGRGHLSFAVPAHLEGSLHALVLESSC